MSAAVGATMPNGQAHRRAGLLGGVCQNARFHAFTSA